LIQPVNRTGDSPAKPTAVRLDGELDAGVTELFLHIGRRNTVGEEQACIRVPKAVRREVRREASMPDGTAERFP
jgi:hypothetical protein